METSLASLHLAANWAGNDLELLKEIVPRIVRVAVLRDVESQSGLRDIKEYEAAAPALKLQLQSLDVKSPTPDLEKAFQAAVKGRAGALVTITNANLLLLQRRIAELAIKHRLPSVYQGSSWVEAGGLMSYSTNDLDAYRRLARYIDKVLKGSTPADLPVEQPMKFDFVINLKTAKQLGLTIPQWTLMKADRVIR